MVEYGRFRGEKKLPAPGIADPESLRSRKEIQGGGRPAKESIG